MMSTPVSMIISVSIGIIIRLLFVMPGLPRIESSRAPTSSFFCTGYLWSENATPVVALEAILFVR